MTIKERVQALLKEKGMSAVQMESDLGFAKGYVSKLDKASPTADKLLKMADYLNVSTDALLKDESQPPRLLPVSSEQAKKIIDESQQLEMKLNEVNEILKRLQSEKIASQRTLDFITLYNSAPAEVQERVKQELTASQQLS